jgi:hypothetical protein
MVESFFSSWINIHVNNGNEEMKNLSSILSKWKIRKINDGPISSKLTVSSNKNKSKIKVIDSNNDIEALKINALGLSGVEYEILKQYPPDMKSFCHLVKLYCGRKAWIPCYHILKFIESDGYKSSLSSLNSSNNSKLNEIDIIYYYTVKAMCESEQFSLAIELVNNMQKTTGKLPNIGIISQLLKILSLPILDNNDETITKKLLTNIGDAILLLDNNKIDIDNELDDNNRLVIDEFKNLNQVFLNSELVSTYIRALCKRGMIYFADEMLEKLYNNEAGKLLISEKSLTHLIHVSDKILKLLLNILVILFLIYLLYRSYLFMDTGKNH